MKIFYATLFIYFFNINVHSSDLIPSVKIKQSENIQYNWVLASEYVYTLRFNEKIIQHSNQIIDRSSVYEYKLTPIDNEVGDNADFIVTANVQMHVGQNEDNEDLTKNQVMRGQLDFKISTTKQGDISQIQLISESIKNDIDLATSAISMFIENVSISSPPIGEGYHWIQKQEKNDGKNLYLADNLLSFWYVSLINDDAIEFTRESTNIYPQNNGDDLRTFVVISRFLSTWEYDRNNNIVISGTFKNNTKGLHFTRIMEGKLTVKKNK